MPIKISATIITFNEEKNIERCLKSLVGVVDEIVVVDSLSKDKTKEICAGFSVTYIENPFEGHIQQKNFAIDCAAHDWILSLDADEALTQELRDSILQVKHAQEFLGYKMNRLTNYCGKWVKHCGWYPDTKVRLVHRKHARWGGVNPHDRLDLENGQDLGFLQGDLLHYSYYTAEDHFKQIEYFGKIAANELFQKGRKSNWGKIVIKTLAQFFKSYFIKVGLLDGKTGYLISVRSAYATYRKYKMLMDLWKQKN